MSFHLWRRGGSDELPKQLLCKMPETLIKAQSNFSENSYILGGALAITDLIYSPIFLKPQPRSEPYDPLHRRSTSISIKEKKLNVDNAGLFLDILCLSLSLTLNTNVTTELSWSFHDPRKFSNMSGVGTSGHGRTTRPSGIPKTFGTDQVGEFEFIFNELNSNIPENLDRAIRRWRNSLTQRNPVDQMIDLRIALEALYLADHISLELGFRLSNRAAWHLGKDVEDRKELQKLFKTIYDMSSTSVHSESINDRKIRKVTNLDRTEFITKSQDLCRDAILKFLKSKNLPTKKGDWSDYWSDLTLGGETFK